MGLLRFIKSFWQKKKITADNMSYSCALVDFKYKTHLEPRFQDFDMMGHVNNATYFTYMEVGRTKYWTHAIGWDWSKTGVIIGSASIDYLQPIFPNDVIHIYVRTSRLGTSSFDLEYILVKICNEREIVCSKGKTVCVAFDYIKKTPVPIPTIERAKMVAFEQLPADKEIIESTLLENAY